MKMSHEIALRRDPMQVGQTLAQSGYFQDAAQAAQAAVKVMAGEELGLGPIAAMTGIHIVKGKVTLSANLIAGLIKRSGKYDFRVKLEPESCVITFFQDGQEIGVSSFTRADATAAGLWGNAGPWKQHPRNMLYARAMSNGAKWYCPDVFSGPVYTPEEFGVEIDGETGEVIEQPAPAQIEAAAQEAPAVNTDALARELLAIVGPEGKTELGKQMKAAKLSVDDLADEDKLAKARKIAEKIKSAGTSDPAEDGASSAPAGGVEPSGGLVTSPEGSPAPTRREPDDPEPDDAPAIPGQEVLA
jgi:hypothetical protein